MDKTTFLATLDAERFQWDASLAQIPATRMLEPGLVGEWSVKDLLAHIVWCEREIVGLLRSRSLQEASAWWNLPQEERNAAIFAAHRSRPLDDVVTEARLIHAQLRALLDQLTDEDWIDPQRYAGMPQDWTPWHIIAQNTYEHYQHHLPALQAWR